MPLKLKVLVIAFTVFYEFFLPVSVLGESRGTPVSCEEYRFSFGQEAVFASAHDSLFRFRGTGWEPLLAPEDWNQVKAAGNNVIYLYDDATNVLHRSDDGGNSWIPVGATPFAQEDNEELFPAPAADILFLSVRSSAAAPNNQGLWKSIDRGFSWHRVLMSSGVLTSLSPVAFSPTFLRDGTAFVAESGRGVFLGIRKSASCGECWYPVNNGLQVPAQYGYRAWLVLSPQFAQDHTLFSGGGPNNWGYYKSTDAGEHWQVIGGLSPTSIAMSPDFLSDGTLLIASPGSGVYVSSDRGNSFRRLWETDGAMIVGMRYATPMDAAATDYSAALVGHTTGPVRGGQQTLEYWAVVQGDADGVCHLYRSQDRGQTWTPQTLYEASHTLRFPIILTP